MKKLVLTLIIGVLVFIGCEDKNSENDNQTQVVPGCTDPDAENYDPYAMADDGSCEYYQGEEVITHDIDAAGASDFY